MKTALYFVLLALGASAGADGSFSASSAAALRAEKAGDKPLAIELHTQALRAWSAKDGKPAKVKALLRRAELFASSGALDKAIKDLAAAIANDPKNAAHHHRRGQLFLEYGDPSQALTDLYRATSLRLDFKEALYDRGRAYERLGEAAFAREDFKAACKLGFKKACEAAATAREAARPAKRPAGDGEAARTEPRFSGQGVEIVRPTAEAPARSEVKLCVALLQPCLNDGETYGRCMRRAKRCAVGQTDPCCPAACVDAFERAARAASELAAYQQVFESSRPCAP